jgi:beta-galactosidase/beta-glucuronidase
MCPGHWQLEGAFAAYEGIVLYRSRFVPRAYPTVKAFSLLFGGAYYSARVWLNGAYLGSHEGYFAQFEFDVTDVAILDEENELLVEVCSPENRMRTTARRSVARGPGGTAWLRT